MPTIDWNGYKVDVMADGDLYLRSTATTSVTMDAEALWTAFAAAYPAYASAGDFHRLISQGGNDTLTRRTGGASFSGDGNDIINDYAPGGGEQIHSYAGAGNDTFNMYFTNITGYSHGHHNRGDNVEDANGNPVTLGSDSFNFMSTSNVGSGKTIVGRLEDYDVSRDTIRIDGTVLNLNALPANVKIVMHNGDHNDSGAAPQQWLVIKTSTGGFIIYSLEGARVDMVGTNGGANSGTQEAHFLRSEHGNANAIIALFNSQPSATYFDPQNYVPAGAVAQGGITKNDHDENAAQVTTIIVGTASGDLIAAGLNNDTVNAGAGNDQVWGGSGHDVVNGEDGNDTLSGNLGNDSVTGGNGNDLFQYHEGADTIVGGAGVDTLVFNGSAATSVSLYANTNNRGLTISGIENLTGGGGADSLIGNSVNNILIGNAGNDTMSGYGGDDAHYGGLGNDEIWGIKGNDTLDGGAGNDKLAGGENFDVLTGGAGNDSFLFNDAAQGGDTITDFGATVGSNDDWFFIQASGFGGGLTSGALATAKFWANTTGLAHDADDRFIFETDTKELYFDIDGTGAGVAVLLATLQPAAANLTALDIVLF